MKLRKHPHFYFTIKEGTLGLNRKQKFSKSDNPLMRNGILQFIKNPSGCLLLDFPMQCSVLGPILKCHKSAYKKVLFMILYEIVTNQVVFIMCKNVVY